MSGIRYSRDRRQHDRLVAFECQDCGWVSYPEQRRTCKRCGAAPAEFEEVQLAERGEVQTYVVQSRLPEEFETPQPVAVVDLPQVDGEGEPARVYGLLTETDGDDLEVGREVVARYRELFTAGDRPVHSFKFAPPRAESIGTDGDGAGDRGGEGER
ncbi:hypothetical protein BRC81_14355 [Halobacteriales archaeon QS_1_68_20]|nr:MAG: hypothetical protein BRC81_14355 [Halobacteriales archaeon QS_1_68_20]